MAAFVRLDRFYAHALPFPGPPNRLALAKAGAAGGIIRSGRRVVAVDGKVKAALAPGLLRSLR